MGSYLGGTATADVVLHHLPILTVHPESLDKACMFFVCPPSLSVS